MYKLKSYYRLCGISSYEKKLQPLVNLIDIKAVEAIYTDEQRKILFVDDEEYFKLQETVIGGDDEIDIEDFIEELDPVNKLIKENNNNSSSYDYSECANCKNNNLYLSDFNDILKKLPKISVRDEFQITII